jgi:hypothetical protein
MCQDSMEVVASELYATAKVALGKNPARNEALVSGRQSAFVLEQRTLPLEESTLSRGRKHFISGLPAFQRRKTWHYGSMTEQEMVALARGKLGTLRELETLLRKRGMPSVIRQPGDGANCNTG